MTIKKLFPYLFLLLSVITYGQNERLKEMLEKNPAGEFLKEIGYDISELGNYDSTKLKEIAEGLNIDDNPVLMLLNFK